MKRIALLLSLAIFGVGIVACQPGSPSAASAQKPIATLQEVMQFIVDPAADGVWDAVATEATKKGLVEKQPRTDAEWRAVRGQALLLIEASNILAVKGRKAAVEGVRSESPAELHPEDIQRLLDTQWPEFEQRAAGLREAVSIALEAIDKKDSAALLLAGGAIEAACEHCHQQFWYPHSKMPLASESLKPIPAKAAGVK